MMKLVLITAPASEPLTTAEAKAHLRVTASDDDAYIAALITTARRHVEMITNRALINQTWDLFLNDFPDSGSIVVPIALLSSVTSVKYTDKDGAQSTLSTTKYHTDSAAEPGQIILAYGQSWPSYTPRAVNAVEVRFVAGYGSAASSVPETIRQAMLLLIGHWYENREHINIGNIVNAIPDTVDALLCNHRIYL